MKREHLFAAFFFAVFLFLLYQLYLFLAPFATPLILAGVLALAFSPMNTWLRQVLRGSRTLTASVMTVAVAIILLVPFMLMLSLLVGEANNVYQLLEARLSDGAPGKLFGETWVRLTESIPVLAAVDVDSLALDASKRISSFVARETASLARDLVLSAFNLTMMLIALFFFFRDGDRISRTIDELIPMEGRHLERIDQLVYDAVVGVMQSSMLIALIQGVLSGLAYWLIGGLTISVLLGFMTGVASLIPLGGATLIWLPSTIYLLLIGELGRGIGLLIFGVVVISSVDNFVRPLVIGGRVQIPTLLLLFALIGGLSVYGFLGIFLAPVVLATLIAFISIYREHFVDETPGPQAASGD